MRKSQGTANETSQDLLDLTGWWSWTQILNLHLWSFPKMIILWSISPSTRSCYTLLENQKELILKPTRSSRSHRMMEQDANFKSVPMIQFTIPMEFEMNRQLHHLSFSSFMVCQIGRRYFGVIGSCIPLVMSKPQFQLHLSCVTLCSKYWSWICQLRYIILG